MTSPTIHICAPSKYCDMFADFDYALGENASDPLTGKPSHQQEWAEAAKLRRGLKVLRWPMYFGCNSFVDYEIGRVHIPTQSGQRFRLNPATDSDPIRPPIPGESGHPFRSNPPEADKSGQGWSEARRGIIDQS